MKCFVCHRDINGKYCIDQWGHNVCASHLDRHEVTMCTACGAFTTEKPIADGRCLCKSCRMTVVNGGTEVNECLGYVLNLLKGVGFEFGSCDVRNIPIEIVSARRIAEIRKSQLNTNNKGVTLTETQMRGTSRSDMKVVGHTHKIYMLSDQPKLEFMGTLAHELLHVWQNEQDIKLATMKCEGLCNMGTYLINLKSDSPIAEFYIKNLKENPDSVYGDGFRYVFAEYEKLGWKAIIQKAKNNTL